MSEQRTDTQEGAQPAAGAAIGAAARSGQPAHPDAAALAEWRRLAEQATPGDWRQGPHYRTDVEARDGRVAECTPLQSPRGSANAAFIAHSSPYRILALLFAYEAERARADAAEMRLRLAVGMLHEAVNFAEAKGNRKGQSLTVDGWRAFIDAALAPEGAGR